MNREQLEKMVIIPTLKEIPRGYSDKAVMAIVMLIAHESECCEYIAQLKDGPAKGIIQMEGWVHDDVWKNSDSIRVNALNLGFTRRIDDTPNSDLLYTNLAYNVFMARQRLFMDTNPLPNNEEDMAVYLKKYWNSEQGKATPEDYLNAYREW